MFKSDIDTPICAPLAMDFRLRSRNASGVPFACCASGVPQPASIAKSCRRCCTLLPSARVMLSADCSLPARSLLQLGVGHPIVPVADVRRTDARRRERDTPEGVTQGFQVSVYKVDPYIDVFARNLLSNDNWRLALRDEVPKSWP